MGYMCVGRETSPYFSACALGKVPTWWFRFQLRRDVYVCNDAVCSLVPKQC